MQTEVFTQEAPERRTEEIAALFTAAFSHSAGEQEGARIGALAGDLISSVAAADRFIFTAVAADELIAAIFFSRITWAGDARKAFLLGPVAVIPAWQGKGVGQKLLRYGLAELQQAGVDIAFTYGDPNYYNKVGFAPISEAAAPPPLPLSHPEGWLAQSLNGQPLTPLQGPSQCVAALNKPEYW